MSYIYLNLFNRRDRARLDPDEAIVRLHEQFPEVIVLPEDQLALSARQAEKKLDPSKPANQAVLRRLSWNTQHLGPAYAFRISRAGEPNIEGVIKRYQADFRSDEPFSAGMRTRVIAFLRSLIPTGIDANVDEEREEETERPQC